MFDEEVKHADAVHTTYFLLVLWKMTDLLLAFSVLIWTERH
jgi:hypothetical protein